MGVEPMPETQSLRQAILEGRLTRLEATERPPPAPVGSNPAKLLRDPPMPSGRRRWLVVRRRWRPGLAPGRPLSGVTCTLVR